ncbi:McrB family protein [Microcoleus asticus]|uniref:5-methylcytosine-specific restriction enzyme B n=1 Tax=Microcoleus asticus IPMA8 TaxID=2563858 RepID=A0ABX2CU76_9CYAN|nr:AAA family ATPase [Microcoleus asticus]NQE33901.1 5-methylcytosine-specific restriction enzyme B [Microcoleus asticus IPMA8]
MEKFFVHPESPFSAGTFNLLARFYENPSSDFYIAHKNDFLKYVENPLKYIFSQVEELLPDIIKKYINIKWEQFGEIVETKGLQSVAYSMSLGYGDINYIDNARLMLRFDNQDLTFGLCAEFNDIDILRDNYESNYINDPLAIDILKRYNLPNQYHCYLTNQIIRCNYPVHEYRLTIMKPQKCIYELLKSIISLVAKQTLKFEGQHKITNIQVARSLEGEEVLGYSAQQLIQIIAQTFKKVFPLFLISNQYDNDLPLLISQYFSVYEKEFNPVYQLEKFSEITGFQTTQLTQWIHTIHRKSQTIIQGPPGTGKTFLAQKLAQHLVGGGDGFSDIIQFHPAYTYEDFIQGIRPQSQDGQLTYPIVPGRFLEFCEKAEVCEDTCVLIIDEINRANLSQVFGELMYLLDDRDRTVKLASGEEFRIPTNVRIIGTMNTADRSIALVDNALRRRFAFIPVYPNYEVLRQYHHREKTGFPVDKLTSLLEDVNRAINNKHYELGISFFLTKTLAEDIQDIWQMEIEPYLEEYFFDNLEKMDEFLWENIKNKLGY